MKSQILLASVMALSFQVFAQDSSAPTTPAVGEIKKEREELKKDREVRDQKEKSVLDDKAQLAKDKASGATADQVKADKQKLRKDRKERNEAQKEVRKERHELRKDIRERKAAKHE